MPKTVTIYEDAEEISKEVLEGNLKFSLTLKMNHGDWDIEVSDPNIEIGTSAFSLEYILNKIMKEKEIPIEFKIRLN